MNVHADDAERTVARIYNSAVAASAIGAAWEIGALDRLQADGGLDIYEFAEDQRLHPPAVAGMFRALASVGVVHRTGTKVVPAPAFAEVCRTRSFFHWLTRGSAELFREMPDVMRLSNRTGDFFRRDGAAIAVACREMNSFCYDPWFHEALDQASASISVCADLGCGSGDRLLQLLRRDPAARGIGIDIAAGAIDVARDAVTAAGMADRVTFIEADVLQLTSQPEFADVRLLTCFMMAHDFWPRDRCVATLRRLREVFPNAERLLLGDATRSAETDNEEPPTFRLAFELGHDLMGVFIPTVSDWMSVFADGGWRVVKTWSIDIAVGEVIFDLVPVEMGDDT
jgi:tRNA G46 methylase TrmB